MPWVDIPGWLDAVDIVIDYKDGRDLADKRDLLVKDIPKSGFLRRLAPPPAPALVEALVEEFPNFQPVIEHIADQLAIAALGNGYLRLPPLLLLGDPGIGKSVFADRLASVLGVKSRTFTMSHATQGGALGGLSSYWGTGSTGEVFNALLRGRELNPVFVLDEIDKAAGTSDGRHNPLGPLFSLLEPEDAKQFTDEYAGVPIDASWFSWVATANELDVLPAPIVSRLTVFEIRSPTRAELRQIGGRQYRRLVESFGLGEHLPSEAPAGLLDQVEASPRELRVLIQSAIGRMARDHMSGHSRSVELRETRLPQKRKMGFL
jgi:ATP-dependent Lon protease